MQYKDMTCNEFMELLSSKAPVPGGGGASALVGSIGMALGIMVANLTLGKKKYEDVEQDILAIRERAELIKQELLLLIDQDAECFEPLSRAYHLPNETQEERAEKARRMESALSEACTVPLKIMEKCCDAIKLHEKLAEIGAFLAISDVGCGASFCKSALQSASLNVFINTKLMTDRVQAEEINQKAEAMLGEYLLKADEIFLQIREKL